MLVNKPFDRVCKAFVDEAPRMFLHLVEIVPLGAPVQLQPLPRETAPPVVMPDSAMRVKTPGRPPFIFHAEIERSFRKQKLRTVALYGGGLMTQHRLPVRTVILLLGRHGNPPFDEGTAEFALSGTRVLHPFRLVRVWELDPAPLLASGDPRVLPWVAMMKSTESQVKQVAGLLHQCGDEDLLARFYMLAATRYDREELEEIVGDRRMGLMEYIYENSSVFAEFRAKEKAQSRLRARVDEARKLLSSCLASKFPGLESMEELRKVKEVDVLEKLLLEHVIGGSDRRTVRQAILKAARQAT